MAAPDFVGREAELRVLGQQLDRCLSGATSLTLVEGEAGIGKSRLVHEFVTDAARRGIRVVWAEAEEVAPPPMGLCTAVVRGVGSYRRPDPALPAPQRRWEVLDALASVLRDAAPVVVVLEDLHWADADSMWVLERLPGRLTPASIHLVGTIRSDEPHAAPLLATRRHAEIVGLGGLTVDAVRALVAAVGGDHDVEVDGLTTRTGGNPLFVRELVALGVGSALPTVISTVLERHLRRLEPRVLRTVTALALAGSAVPTRVLAQALDRDPGAVADDLEAATAARILQAASGPQPRFRHDLYAATALSLLASSDRRALHVRFAAAWKQLTDAVDRVASVRHGLAALPLGDAPRTGAEALQVAQDLAAAGELAQAAQVAGDARKILAAHGEVPAELLARLAFVQGEALWEAGVGPAAAAASEDAATLAAAVDDPELSAASEAAAARHVDPFTCDPDRIRRLRTADASLPAGDHPTRVQVLGRLAVLHAADPDLIAEAHRCGDRAVAMARRLDDPALLVAALTDRHLVPVGPEGGEGRARAADEIVRLGEQLRRPDLAAFGHEWRFEGALERGDRDDAEQALDRLHLNGMMLPSPEWRYKALFRRAILHLCDGDRAEALDLVPQIWQLGSDLVVEAENVAMELSIRTGARLLWKAPDARHDELVTWTRTRLEGLPPFVRVVLAAADWARADMDRVREVVETFAPVAHRLLRTYRGAALVGLLGAMAAASGAAEHAGVLRAALASYRGRVLLVTVLPMACDSVLGRLASLDGDHVAAADQHRAAVRTLEHAPFPGLLPMATAHLAEALERIDDPEAAATWQTADRLADRFGMGVPDRDPPGVVCRDRQPALVGSACLRRHAQGWDLDTPLGAGRVADARGMAHLARLLTSPGIEVAATELAGMVGEVPAAADLGPSLDARAKREYRQRVADLQDDIDAAEAANDADRATLARQEMELLLEELRRAVGLGGRDRPSGSGAERARVNVTRNLRRAIEAIAAVTPALGAHLDRSVRTGRYCAYDPEPAAALVWSVQAGVHSPE